MPQATVAETESVAENSENMPKEAWLGSLLPSNPLS